MNRTAITDYRFLSMEEATNPSRAGYYEHHINKWWTVHSELGLAFYCRRADSRRTRSMYAFPQCNSNEIIARKVSDKIGYDWPNEIVFIPSAWVPVDIRDLTS